MFMPCAGGALAAPGVFVTDWKFPTANAVYTVNEYPLQNPTNAYADNGALASSGSQSWAQFDATDSHIYTGFGFSASDLPSNVTVTGVEVEMEAVASGGNFSFRPRLYLATTGVSGNQTTPLDDTTSVVLFGGSSELWGEASMAVSDLRAASFGVIFNVSEADTNPFTASAGMDYLRVRIHGTR